MGRWHWEDSLFLVGIALFLAAGVIGVLTA